MRAASDLSKNRARRCLATPLCLTLRLLRRSAAAKSLEPQNEPQGALHAGAFTAPEANMTENEMLNDEETADVALVEGVRIVRAEL